MVVGWIVTVEVVKSRYVSEDSSWVQTNVMRVVSL